MPTEKLVVRSVIHGLEKRDKKAQLAAVAAGEKPHSVHKPGEIVELDTDDPAVKELIRPGVLERVEAAISGVRDPNADGQNLSAERTETLEKKLTNVGEGPDPVAATPGVGLPAGAKLPSNDSPANAKPKG
jgi:hypothetical protein